MAGRAGPVVVRVILAPCLVFSTKRICGWKKFKYIEGA